jgi:Nucleotidyl transferase AbiEii toxin, Type IV TA system
MNLNALHRRLLQDVLEIGNAFPFVITGGYAVQAHGLVDRLSRDIDVATDSSVPMDSLAGLLVAGLTERGWLVRVIGVDPVSARFMVTDQGTGEDCEVDILKEGFNRPPETTPYGPVLALDDVIGTKVRALADRGYPRDLVDIHAASRIRSQGSWNRSAADAPGVNSAWMDLRQGLAPSNGVWMRSSRHTACPPAR